MTRHVRFVVIHMTSYQQGPQGETGRDLRDPPLGLRERNQRNVAQVYVENAPHQLTLADWALTSESNSSAALYANEC